MTCLAGEQVILHAITTALESMDRCVLELSCLDLGAASDAFPCILEANVLERPFAYEFYHQLRMLWNNQRYEALFSGVVIQGEVAKRYQGLVKDVDNAEAS